MRFEIRDANKRLKLDAKYLDYAKSEGLTCPKCGKADGLKLRTNMECSVFIYCDYKIECKSCGYVQKDWYDTTPLAIDAMKAEIRANMNHE